VFHFWADAKRFVDGEVLGDNFFRRDLRGRKSADRGADLSRGNVATRGSPQLRLAVSYTTKRRPTDQMASAGRTAHDSAG